MYKFRYRDFTVEYLASDVTVPTESPKPWPGGDYWTAWRTCHHFHPFSAGVVAMVGVDGNENLTILLPFNDIIELELMPEQAPEQAPEHEGQVAVRAEGYQARCSCRWVFPVRLSRGVADRDLASHLSAEKFAEEEL